MSGATLSGASVAAKARRRFETLAGGMPGVDLSRLPKDELGLRRSGLAGYGGVQRYHPSDMSLYEVRLPSNDRLGRSGHVNIASPSKEAVEVEYSPGSVCPAASESDTEVSLFDGGRGAKGIRLETRQLVGGGSLRLVSGPGTQAALLELPDKLLFAELGPFGSNLVTAHTAPLNPAALSPNRPLSV